jgi:hypothetical protein
MADQQEVEDESAVEFYREGTLEACTIAERGARAPNKILRMILRRSKKMIAYDTMNSAKRTL